MQKRPGTESGTPQASKAKSGHANKVPGRFFCLLSQCLADSSTAPTRVPTTQHAAFKENESDPRPAHPGSVGRAPARLAGRSTQVVVFAAGSPPPPLSGSLRK